MTDSDSYEYGEIVKITGNTSAENITLQINDPSGKTVLIRNIDVDQGFSFNFNLSNNLVLGNYDIVASVVIDGIPKFLQHQLLLLQIKNYLQTHQYRKQHHYNKTHKQRMML